MQSKPIYFNTVFSVTIMISASIWLVAITQGVIDIPISQFIQTSAGQSNPLYHTILWDLRLPRSTSAFLIGAILGVCGTMMQAVFRNPLADPGIIGVSAGAAAGAAIALTCLPENLHNIGLPAFAFIGSLSVSLCVYRFSFVAHQSHMTLLILSGVALSALCSAIVGVLSYLADDDTLRNLSLWQMGSVAQCTLEQAFWLSIMLAFTLAYAMYHAKNFNALMLGEHEARYLGIAIEKVKFTTITITALAVGLSVSLSGVIGFIGLVVPHCCRMLVGSCHKGLIPLSALVGGNLLLGADWLSRIVINPAELPIGLITAALGTPFFISILQQQKKQLT